MKPYYVLENIPPLHDFIIFQSDAETQELNNMLRKDVGWCVRIFSIVSKLYLALKGARDVHKSIHSVEHIGSSSKSFKLKFFPGPLLMLLISASHHIPTLEYII